MKTNRVFEGADILDSREIIDKIAELEQDEENLDEEDKEELAKLRKLAEEGEGSPDWHYGETLIADSYFKEYAQDLAEDIGAINHDASWPNTCIDWEEAAEQLQRDYFTVEYGETTYWIRA